MLSDVHMFLLDWISDHPSATIEEAAGYFDIDIGAVAELWSGLVNAGYLAPTRGDMSALLRRARRPPRRASSPGRARAGRAPGRL